MIHAIPMQDSWSELQLPNTITYCTTSNVSEVGCSKWSWKTYGATFVNNMFDVLRQIEKCKTLVVNPGHLVWGTTTKHFLLRTASRHQTCLKYEQSLREPQSLRNHRGVSQGCNMVLQIMLVNSNALKLSSRTIKDQQCLWNHTHLHTYLHNYASLG